MHGPDLVLTARRLLIALLLAPACSSFAQEPVDLLVHGGTIVTMDADFRVIEDGALAVRDERSPPSAPQPISRSLRSEAQAGRSRRDHYAGPRQCTRPCRDVALPRAGRRPRADGLAPQLTSSRRKQSWSTRLLSAPDETKLALLEMALGGTTTYVDMYYFEDAVADETAKAGLRGVLGQTLIDFRLPTSKPGKR